MPDTPTNAQITAEITLLGVSLEAIYNKTAGGTTILVLQHFIDAGSSSVTVAKMVDQLQTDIKNLSSELGDISLPVPSFSWPNEKVKVAAESLTITVKEVYLYIDIPASPQGENPSGSAKTVQYAFSISINNSSHLEFPLTVESVGLKFWNATNKNVLAALGIINIDEHKPA